MALPSGIATKVVTLGKYYAADGTLLTGWTATVVVSQDLRWTATGDVILQTPEPVTVAADGTGSVRLPVTDQTGFVSSNNSPASNWSYTISFGSSLQGKRAKIFSLPGAATDPFDADNVADGSVAPAAASTATYVNSITLNGTTYTGNAVLPDSVTGAGTTTVAGITNATAIGQSLLLSADTNAAQTAIGVQDLRGLIAALTTTVANLQTTVTSQAATITALTTSDNGKIPLTAVGVTVAGLDGARKLPLANLTPQVPLLIGDGSATVPTRPATTNPVIFDTTGTVPATGSTAGGSAAGVNGLDRQWT